MGRIPSLDFVLIESTIFGVNQDFTGRHIGPGTAWTLGILNLCFSVTISFFMIKKYAQFSDRVSVDFVAKGLYYDLALAVIVFIQIRTLFRRRRMASVGRELYRLYELSTWEGDIYGCIGRILGYLIVITFHQTWPRFQTEWKYQEWRFIMMGFYWINFAPTAATEFVGQAMLLFGHEFKVLSEIAKQICKNEGENFKIAEKLRALNRRHASLLSLCNSVARITGIDSLLMIETERLLILISIFISVNEYATNSADFVTNLITVLLYIYRIERITHYSFRGYRLEMEAERFVVGLNEIDPLRMENDETFTEIFRKQVKLRELNFNCDRLLKMDMKLIFQISKDLFTLLIILVQLTTPTSISISKSSNVTETSNHTEHPSSILEAIANTSNINNQTIEASTIFELLNRFN